VRFPTDETGWSWRTHRSRDDKARGISAPSINRTTGMPTLYCVLEDLEAAGLFDPAAPDVEYRRAITRHLLEVGLPTDDVIAVLGAEDPQREACFRLLFPGPRVPIEEFVDRVGLSIEQLERIRLAAGLPPVHRGFDGDVFSVRDEATFVALNMGREMFGEDAILQFVRVMGSALAQVAEAAVAVFGTRIEGPLVAQHAPADVRFKAELEATRLLALAGSGLDTLFRFHAETAIRRLAQARAGVDSFESARLVVGFVDLVGFTPLAASVDARQLGELFDGFEALASDVIAEHDARLVKLIGDAVMFCALDANAACDIALTLVEQFSDDSNPVTPRGALALGEMLVRGGDYYGPVVNLAARAADLAVPHEVLVSEEVVAASGDAFVFAPAGRRLLKGFDEPVALATLARAGS
jgi:adenylate cyclase